MSAPEIYSLGIFLVFDIGLSIAIMPVLVTFLRWRLENLQLHVWLTLYFC